jgi:hypothetical protein
MQVKTGGHISFDARARADAIDDLLFHDYYSRTPRLRLTGEAEPDAATEVVLEDNDVVRLVECAIRHPSLNMRHAVLTAIWNHPESFRGILRFGLQAPEAFPEIRQVVAEELARHRPAPAAAAPDKPMTTLLPRVPLPPHLRRSGEPETGRGE